VAEVVLGGASSGIGAVQKVPFVHNAIEASADVPDKRRCSVEMRIEPYWAPRDSSVALIVLVGSR
jgi:hypothetical protein